MVPRYDFDIRWLIPRELEADPAIGKLLGDVGFNTHGRGNYIALFRDPEVVAAIQRADPVLREFLKASGFGFTAYHSGAPAGYYPAADDAARTDVITRLDHNLKDFELKGADLGGFEFGPFLKAIVEGQPLPATAAGSAPTATAASTSAPAEPEAFAMPTGYAKLSGRNRVLPLMVVSLAATLGIYWLIQHIEMAPVSF